MSSSYSGGINVIWIHQHCNNSKFLCEVDEYFIRQSSNLGGLEKMVPRFDNAIRMILDYVPRLPASQLPRHYRLVEESAEKLYGLIHARYLMTPKGLETMKERYLVEYYGACPRVACNSQAVLPIGLSDVPEVGEVKVYCPKCKDVFWPNLPKVSNCPTVDGAYFGLSFPHMFFMEYPELRP